MAKMVGLSRPIKIEWLNKTVELIKEGKTTDEISKELKFYLSFEVKDETNLNKTRSSLIKIWVKTPDEYNEIKEHALKIYDNENTNRLLVHWCMMLLVYPVFSDTTSLIGKMADIQGTFTTSWLKQKLLDLWGERTTLLYSVDKILQTLKNIGAIENIKQGEYKIKNYEIQNEAEKSLIVMTIIAIKIKAYYEVTELSEISQMFPFKYNISHELLQNSDLFILNNFGGKVVVTAE